MYLFIGIRGGSWGLELRTPLCGKCVVIFSCIYIRVLNRLNNGRVQV